MPHRFLSSWNAGNEVEMRGENRREGILRVKPTEPVWDYSVLPGRPESPTLEAHTRVFFSSPLGHFFVLLFFNYFKLSKE